VWQELREELHPHGLEVVTVALDTGGAEAARRWIEAAQPRHPALIDQAHLLDELLGIVNVPSGVWIDEQGTIVRPPETAYPRRPAFFDRPIPPHATPLQAAAIHAVKRLRIDAETYVSALRDWVAHGAASPHALTPAELRQRSGHRSWDQATAVAHFELGQHLHLHGDPAAAVDHFRAAQRLYPENWTYKRQAWNLAGTRSHELYGTDWLTEVQKIGPEQYYPPLRLP
jgi:hypothetical protein